MEFQVNDRNGKFELFIKQIKKNQHNTKIIIYILHIFKLMILFIYITNIESI
jgi:hypothetical protein